jgi:ATP-binding cassette subfamily C protein
MVGPVEPGGCGEEALRALSGSAALLLDDPASAWIVETGEVGVFAVELSGSEPAGSRHYVFSARPGEALFGMDLSDGGPPVGYLAVGLADTRVRRLGLTDLREQAGDRGGRERLAALVDGWVAGLARGLVGDSALPTDTQLVPGQEAVLTDGQTARPQRGVVWVRLVSGDAGFLGGDGLAAAAASALFPLPESAWLQAVGACTLVPLATTDALAEPAAWLGLEAFHRVLRACQRRALDAAQAAEADRLDQQADHDRAVREGALAELSAVLDPRAPFASGQTADSPLVAACGLVGDALGVAIQAPPQAQGDRTRDPLAAIVKASRLRTRLVTLRGEWWREESGPLLGYLAGDRQPVALLPAAGRCYDLVDPVARTRTRVDRGVADQLAPDGRAFYRSLPEGPLRTWDLVRFGLRDARTDLLHVLLLGTAGALLGMVIPIATGIIFGIVIPRAEEYRLLQIAATLVAITLWIGLFNVTQNLAVLRVETKVSGPLQAAVWDRLLRLPAPFFREYSAGDLAARAMAIDAIRQTLTGATTASIVAGVFSLLNLALLFYFDRRLALLAVALAAVTLGAIALAGYCQLRYLRPGVALRGRIAGMVLQFITGITKLRVAAAEGRAFAEWAHAFAAQRRLTFQAERVANWLVVYDAVWPVLTSMAIFAVVAYFGHDTVSPGAFLAFTAAFGSFLTAVLTLGITMSSTLQVVPLYERARPILETRPEVDATKADPGALRGAVELSHVAFRYRADRPLVLDDVCLQAQPGEFVALVGPSGAGKSSLFRLLLGFEAPEAGAIYYDGQKLADLDLEAVRQQIGVVLQGGKVQPGTIFENIVGSSLRTQDEAWDAAAMVGLAEQIRALPMGMQTYVSEGGTTFSGGQRQLLMIARALVKKPRILLFDEATSALDNRTQAVVSQSLEALQATRLVIAHRLSTIERADRIYVLQGGRVIQVGAYGELLVAAGPFAELARRQLA